MNKKYVVSEKLNVRETITYMESINTKAVVVLDSDDKMIGLFTNGDMRHFFLGGGSLQENITSAMNSTPQFFTTFEEVQAFRQKKHLVIYPIVDKDMKYVDAILDEKEEDNLITNDLCDVPLVIMAGGKGTRLYPYTQILPKALIPIGEKTISERIIERFRQYGCKDVYFILNHKAGMIKAYYNEQPTNSHINFLEEEEFLGTGGGIKLLKGMVNHTFFLSNCDIIINADLACAYRTHQLNHNVITFVCAMKEIKIPYGVVETDQKGSIKKITEKPELSFLTNTGMYILEPEVIDSITEHEFIHMPEVAARYMDKGFNVGVFPIHEREWLDMGQLDELENMKRQLESGK